MTEIAGTELTVRVVPLQKGILYLPSIVNYTEPKRVADALLDDNFTSPRLSLVAQAVLKEDEKERALALRSLQSYCSDDDLKKVELALNNKGYAYDQSHHKIIINWQNCHFFEHSHEPTLNDIVKTYQNVWEPKTLPQQEIEKVCERQARWDEMMKQRTREVSQFWQHQR